MDYVQDLKINVRNVYVVDEKPTEVARNNADDCTDR